MIRQMVSSIYQVPVGVLLSSIPDHIVLMVNPALENIIGIPAEKITGKHFTQTFLKKCGKLYYPDQTILKTEKFIQHFQSANHIVIKDFEVILQRPDGKQSSFVLVKKGVNYDRRRRTHQCQPQGHR